MSIAGVSKPNEMLVRSGQGDYSVRPTDAADELTTLASRANALFLIDRRVQSLHPSIASVLPAARTFALDATEANKTLQGVEAVCLFLQEAGASKTTTLVAIGGGITQDVGTFAAHIYYRGIPLIFFPTTLLAMSDSCIGAKCGVNLGSFKNQLGCFQSPAQVFICDEFLSTLDADDIRSGFGEMVKLAITDGAQRFSAFERRMSTSHFSIERIAPEIFASLETKRRIIEEDEYESGLRKTLNYGHTFGHALESATENEVPHGLAVAWGVDVANFVSMKRGLLAPEDFSRMHRLIAEQFRLTVSHAYTAEELVARMGRDKKASGKSVTLILPKQIGELALVPTALDRTLISTIEEYLEQHDIFVH